MPKKQNNSAEKSNNDHSGAKVSDQEYKERQRRYNREYYLRVVRPARKGLPATLLDACPSKSTPPTTTRRLSSLLLRKNTKKVRK